MALSLRRGSLFPVALVVLVLVASASIRVVAARGIVVATVRGCDYFVAETPAGFAVLEWYGGATPTRGNGIVGDFESYGFIDIYDLTAETRIHVWVEDFWLTKSRAFAKLVEKCD